ncbi:MAG: relaxase/mobilization nuclease domain-containing protein [Terrimonas sp.]|nr:relaxase/mobilization nuclease domain-containing protein [Terrimonas sp.]
MVARINTSKSISKALNYNEEKMSKNKAEILSASGFLKDPEKLSFYDKLNHFERFISLNDRAVTNTLHVSLNFDPSEQLSNEKLAAIADRYMQQIGFGQQPYLVYRHYDAGHPHIHIVSTNIQKDGKRISMHNMGRNQSEKARKDIEKEFGLVRADSKKTSDTFKVVPVNASKVVYGKSETKRAIANVLMVVLNRYKYSSLPELNAVLKLYNVVSDRGSEDSKMFQQKGLTYRVLDENGNKVGTPIKASAFYMKPTLVYLEKKFDENEPLKTPLKKKLKAAIDWQLNKPPANLAAFIKALEKENISTVLRTGKDGVIYDITYVDHKNKAVFNGSDIGKPYSAKAILEKCGLAVSPIKEAGQMRNLKEKPTPIHEQKKELAFEMKDTKNNAHAQVLALADSKPTPDYVPHQLKKRKRKKHKRISL